jgi:hypothetical protein
LALLQIKFYSTAQSAIEESFSLNIMQVVNWSTWLSALVSIKDRIPVESRNGEGIAAKPKEIEDEEPVQFNLLKATGDLLMLPKDILLDSEIRREALLKPFPSRLCRQWHPRTSLCVKFCEITQVPKYIWSNPISDLNESFSQLRMEKLTHS